MTFMFTQSILVLMYRHVNVHTKRVTSHIQNKSNVMSSALRIHKE